MRNVHETEPETISLLLVFAGVFLKVIPKPFRNGVSFGNCPFLENILDLRPPTILGLEFREFKPGSSLKTHNEKADP
jgi:hypothetical protein